MSNEPETQITTISSPMTDTPEGMDLMDRIEAKARAEREAFAEKYGEEVLARMDAAWEEAERRVLSGSAAVRPAAPRRLSGIVGRGRRG